MRALDPETEKKRWRLALSVPSVVVAATPFFVVAMGLCSRWGFGPGLKGFEEFVRAAKYANGLCTGLLLVGAALILSYAPTHKNVAVSALVLAAIGTTLHFGLYSFR